jgi:hypothetical protein
MEMPVEIGTAGEVDPCLRRGLPSHIDGVPVPDTVPVLTLPRFYSMLGEPLPMAEVREDGDGGASVAARWPVPFPKQDLDNEDS